MPANHAQRGKKRECIQLGGPRRKRIYNERQRALFKPCSVTPTVNDENARLFGEFWAKTDFMRIVRNTVHIQPFTFHDYPP